uniref:Uncharacterized protein n=1 Tax=Triticum urartu TaxID=4572 RepID=A0A8R7USN4_TRIUA
MKSKELCKRKTKFVLKHMSTVSAQFVFHLMLFGHQTLQPPKTFVHNRSHEISDFFGSCFDFTVHHGVQSLLRKSLTGSCSVG